MIGRNNLWWKEVDLGTEINFEIFDEEGYLFRLVPDDSIFPGFDISPLDKALGIEKDFNLIIDISQKIHQDFF